MLAMKKILITTLGGIIVCSGVTFASWMSDVVSRMHEKGLTKFKTESTFWVNKLIRRDEAAKFFSTFSPLLEKTKKLSKSDCKFSDLNEGWKDSIPYIKYACKRGFISGSKWKFNPKGNLTNAQAITILMRMIDGNLDSWSKEYWSPYYLSADYKGLLTKHQRTNPKDKITRWELAQLLKSAYEYHKSVKIKEETPTIIKDAEKKNETVLNEKQSGIIESQNNCDSLVENLKSCTPYVCSAVHSIFWITAVYQIEKKSDSICQFTTFNKDQDVKVVCSLQQENLLPLSQYFKKFFGGKKIEVSRSVSSHTGNSQSTIIDGEELEDPFSSLQEKGACKTVYGKQYTQNIDKGITGKETLEELQAKLSEIGLIENSKDYVTSILPLLKSHPLIKDVKISEEGTSLIYSLSEGNQSLTMSSPIK